MTSDRSAFSPQPKTPRLLPYRPPARTMTLEQIEELQAANEAEERAEIEAERAAHQAREEARAVVRREADDAKRELAKDLNTTPSGLSVIVPGRTAMVRDLMLKPIWFGVEQLLHIEPNLDKAIESRITLGGIGELPPVRDDDPVFGGASGKRALAIPRCESGPVDLHDQYKLERFCRLNGIEWPAELLHEPRREEVDRDQVCRDRDRGRFDPRDGERNASLADHKVALLEKRAQDRWLAARTDYRGALAKFRGQIVASVDKVIAELEPSVERWWTTELRRHVAGQGKKRVSDDERVFYVVNALGISFTSHQPSKPATAPSRKSK